MAQVSPSGLSCRETWRRRTSSPGSSTASQQKGVTCSATSCQAKGPWRRAQVQSTLRAGRSLFFFILKGDMRRTPLDPAPAPLPLTATATELVPMPKSSQIYVTSDLEDVNQIQKS